MITINVKNIDDENNEYRAALKLRDCILETIPEEAIGEMHIVTGVNVPFGKVSDIDILLVANIDNCFIAIDGRDVVVKSFCTVIELKEQTEENVYPTTTDVWVNYPSTQIRKNASAQNRNQKSSLLKYCQRFGHNNLIISNVLWLKSISIESWGKKGWCTETPVLLSSFDFCDIVKQIIKSGHRVYDGAMSIRNNDTNSLNRLVEELTLPRPIPPTQLRSKVEKIVADKLENSVDIITRDESGFCCVDGKAGTGKTFLMLRAALKQASNGYECALLTYNKALTLDLQRLISFIPATSDERNNLEISTLHSFMYSLTKKIGWTHDYEPNKVLEYISQLLKSYKVESLYEANIYDLSDFVFIDEAQDCSPEEKNILECVFGKSRIVVAKSALQKIRRQQVAKWGTPNIKLTQGLRQKANIVTFLQSLASEMGISDTCAGTNSIIDGGTVIIDKHYTTDMHSAIEKKCEEGGCSNYDILILMPPTMVKDKKFINAQKWREQGKINLIDGTNTSVLETCTTKELIDSCRIYQYESCRGLEGWVTVCYNLDDIVNFKIKDAIVEDVIGNYDELRMKDAYQWIMMPLTRAIDTLVITIRDTKTPVAQVLRKVASKHTDFVVCNI